jgi:drug/metabolite transporter (DMT)-like permease
MPDVGCLSLRPFVLLLNTIKAHSAVLGTNLFFAINYSLIKFVSPSLAGPFAVTLLRSGGSLLLFWLAWFFEKGPAGIHKKDIGRFAACGILGIAINQMLFIKGLTLTSTIHASLLTLATPLLVTVFALWVLKEGFTLYKALGLLLGIGGALLLILQKQGGDSSPDYLYGDLLILLNAIAYAGYFILVKPLTEKYSPLHVVRWAFTFGCILVLPFSWKETAAIHWAAFDAAHAVALIVVVVAGTFLAYYFNAYAIDKLGPAISGTYIYTQPLFAVLIATLLLGESMTVQKILAALLIFGGVYLVSFQPRRRKDMK